MKRAFVVALVMTFAVGCAARNGGGGGRGSVIQRSADDAAQRDHASDFSQRPIGQR